MLALEKELAATKTGIERIALSDDLRDDPDYSDPVPNISYADRFNLRVVRKGSGGGRTLLFNTHADVVPPSEGMAAPGTGRAEYGAVSGRVACECTGQVATHWLVLRRLRPLDGR